MKKQLTNKHFYIVLFLLCSGIAYAHDCSSPSDCEETAGYNAVIAITGGLIALVAGLTNIWLPNGTDTTEDSTTKRPQPIHTTHKPQPDPEEEFREEDLEDLDLFQEEEEEFREEDLEDIDEFEEEFLEEDLEDIDEFEIEEETTESANTVGSNEETSQNSGEDGFHQTTQVLDTANNIKTVFETVGLQAANMWAGSMKREGYLKAGERFRAIIDKLKNRGLHDLASRYGARLNNTLKRQVLKDIASKTSKARGFFRNLQKIELGKLADAFTFINNFRKKTDGAISWKTVGAFSEESFRVLFKTVVTKNPVVAVVDAIASLSGQPNLDYLIDQSIEKTREASRNLFEEAYDNKAELDTRIANEFKLAKERISKLNISEIEKTERLKQALKIIKSKG